MQLESEPSDHIVASKLADPDIITRLLEAIPPQTLSGWETQLLERAADHLQDIKDWHAESFHFTGAERERLSNLANIYLGETLEWK
jgi:hypothetical protein